MRSIERLLNEYSEGHQHIVNKILHWICVPLIVLSLLGLLWSIDTPGIFLSSPVLFNWAVLLVLLAMIYYFILSPSLALGMLFISALILLLLHWIDNLPLSLGLISLFVFIVAWIGQFIGHAYEGKRPSFFKDLQFLLIGPLWLLSFVYRKLHLSY